MLEPIKQWYNSLNERERMIVTLGAAVMGCIALYMVGKNTLWEMHEQNSEELRFELQQYEKIASRVENRKRIEREMKAYEGLRRKIDGALLNGSTPELATPELNKIIKDLASKSGIKVNRLQPRNNKEYKEFIVISVAFPVRCTTSELKDFLFAVETYDKLLMIPELKIRTGRRRNPVDIRADIVVAGLIRKPREPQGEES